MPILLDHNKSDWQTMPLLKLENRIILTVSPQSTVGTVSIRVVLETPCCGILKHEEAGRIGPSLKCAIEREHVLTLSKLFTNRSSINSFLFSSTCLPLKVNA